MKKHLLLLGMSYLGSGIAAEPVTTEKTEKQPANIKQSKAKTDKYQGEEMITYGTMTDRTFPNTTKSTPTYTIDAADVKTKINATTAEDTIRYAPGVLIRKRFMGDPNGNLGIRSSNTFQTAHSMVYADGMPLHNPLRTTFNGAPRWSMVSPSEIEVAEVLYGPFSSQYSGNSMGGVINLYTRMPERFEAQMDATGMFQDVHRSGRNETLTGYKTFISAGDRIDKFSVWGSYNRFENEGQPMTINAAALTTAAGGTPITGGEGYQTTTEAPAIAYGDIGVAQQTTDLFKAKFAYDFTEELQGRFTIAYEDRVGKVDNPNSLLRDAAGNTVWGGATAAGLSANQNYRTANGRRFTVPGSVFSVSTSERQALNYGLGLKGKISDNWSIDTTASYYDAFKDRTISSNLNPNHPLNRNRGQISDEKPWWATYDLKLATDKFLGRDDLSFMGGYQFNHASLNLDVYSSNNYRAGSADLKTNESGGATQTNSAFSQLEWRFLPDWSIMAGGRFDHWQALDGHVRVFDDPTTVANERNIQNYADRDASRFSPKTALEFSPGNWTFRYSFSKAYRFPIAEEMFASLSRLNSITTSAPGLGPETGYFHNFMTQYGIPRGYVRANFFFDQINNEINSTQVTINGQTTTTFQPINQTEAVGVDLTFQQNGVFDLPVDLMANTIIMDKHITKHNPIGTNSVNYTGKEWDRIPQLQINGSLTYHIMQPWDASVGVRYRSDSFQTLANTDTAANVMGGTDESTFVDLKTTYKLPINRKLKSTISAGIDNVFDANAFENHPYPQRTYFISASLKY
ncbi:TonB-dependent receptor [Methylobacter sp.]|uniref:TonB-dependent receptor n=1 Tax=Methylobacter sp. TaxID=2051955 RepID=UPI00121B3C28|nr:TonB-dependent receptor [Methylobacter sp.]TAK62857.1 MAG: TonB-dependent receptor [Methylobacter sp.]